MSKPIVLTEEYIRHAADEFMQQLRSLKLSDGKITYTKTFKYDSADKVSVLFTPSAYSKMLMLLNGFDTEVAWHGLVERRSDTEFLIYDIIVYPQEVTGVTANTDQDEYQKWLIELDDDTANAMHMQSHSHVRMSVTPSQTDLTYWDSILQQVPVTGFYIFMIFNQRLEHTVKVYDRAHNTLYEGSDVIVAIDGDESLDGFMDAAKKLVRTRTAAVTSYGYTVRETKPDTKNKKPVGKAKQISLGSDKGADLGMHQSPGYYGGYGAQSDPDFDEYIFGRRAY